MTTNAMRSLALGLAALAAGGLSFAPEPGSSLTKRFELRATLQPEETTLRIGGQEHPLTGEPEPMGMRREVVVTDEYVAVADGRPTELVRSFDRIVAEASDGDEVQGSELEHERVVFTWQEDEGAYRVDAQDGAAVDADLLAGLREDMDLRGFLPAGEVEEGDTWDVGPEALAAVIAAGGNLAIGGEPERPSDEEGRISIPGPPAAPWVWTEGLEGVVTAVHAGTLEQDDVRVTVVEVEFDVSCSNDVSEWLALRMRESDEVDSADLSADLRGEARLYWDAAAGHVHGFELDGRLEVELDVAWTAGEEPMRFQLEVEHELSGELHVAVARKGAD